MNDDDRLRSAFAELRRAEAARVPPFAVGRRRRQPYVQFAFALVLLIAAIVVVPLVRRHETPEPSIVTWRAPTDFLLQTPGRELLQSVPDMKGTRQ